MASSGVEEDSAARRQEAKKFDVFAFEETLISSAMLDALKVQQPTGCLMNKCAYI